MCNAFSAIITKEGNVYWKLAKDSHEDIIDLFKVKDKLLADNKLPSDFIRFEITPENNDYLNPEGKWDFKFDDDKPKWWNNKFEALCWAEQKKWKKKVYAKFDWQGLKNPVNPFDIEPPEITDDILELLKQWASVRVSVWDSVGVSVRDSVRASVWDLVGDLVGDSVGVSVRDSVRASVWDLVGDLVGASVRASVWAYIGSFFYIKKWKYCDFKYTGYPFQCGADLWKLGLVPVYYDNKWHLLGGKNAGELWSGNV